MIKNSYHENGYLLHLFVVAFFSYMLTFFTSPTIGSISDSRGRKALIIAGIALSIVPNVVFVALFALGIVLKPLNECLGEKYIVVISFICGVLNNLLYGIASSKTLLLIAGAVVGFTKLSLPTISAIVSNNVESNEQGRVQGALFSVMSLSFAVGPLALRAVYYLLEDVGTLRSGNMFIFAALFYVLALMVACGLPRDRTDSSALEESDEGETS